MSRRPYEQRLRAESAEENRRRVLGALYERVREAPSQPISIDEIARRARVARSTVYLAFGSRTGLFDALTRSLLEGPGRERLIASLRLPVASDALRGALAAGVDMYAPHRDVFRVLSSMAKLDPEGVGHAVGLSEAERARGIARMARRLAEEGALRPGVGADEAADLIWLLAGFDAYDALADRGLDAGAAAAALVRTAERALLEDGAGAG